MGGNVIVAALFLCIFVYIYSGVEAVMFKDICPYGLGGSTLLTDMGFFYEKHWTYSKK